MQCDLGGRINVSCRSARLVLVHGGSGDSLLAITLIGLALVCSSRHPRSPRSLRSLHSHAFFIAIALALILIVISASFHPGLSQWTIVIAIQNLDPLMSAYSILEKVAK